MVRSFQQATFSNSAYFDDRGEHGVAVPITTRVNPHSRPIVSYYFPKGVGEHHYGERHPMKPHRLTLTNTLVLGYGLDKQIHQIYSPPPATRAELEEYHDPEYIDFLSSITPQNQNERRQAIDSFNCTEDCPIFSDMYEFCRMYAGGSLAGSRKLCAGTTDIAINWSGGLHHAKRGEASGFCYVNDIVLAILEMLKYYPRVLYIDIDIHHGDGVELAFYQSNRVMTVSFHKYTGEFFPGTGKLDDNGMGLGKHFAINVPLQDGITDEMYTTTFKTVIDDVVTSFRPSAIVLQCGADSLGCDRLGAFNLSIAAHGDCVDFVRAFNVPLLVLGGGGYNIKNVSRCWTYETSVLVGAEIPDELPQTIFDGFFADSQWKLHPPLTGRVENQNTEAGLRRIMISIRNKLRYLQGAPSIAMQELPPDLANWIEAECGERDREEERLLMAERRAAEKTAVRNEFFDGENDVDQEDVPVPAPVPSPVKPRGTPARRTRGTRKTRGRGRTRTVSSAIVRDEDDADEPPEEPVTKKAKAVRGRATRGRGKGRTTATAIEVEASKDGSIDMDTAEDLMEDGGAGADDVGAEDTIMDDVTGLDAAS